MILTNPDDCVLSCTVGDQTLPLHCAHTRTCIEGLGERTVHVWTRGGGPEEFVSVLQDSCLDVRFEDGKSRTRPYLARAAKRRRVDDEDDPHKDTVTVVYYGCTEMARPTTTEIVRRKPDQFLCPEDGMLTLVVGSDDDNARANTLLKQRVSVAFVQWKPEHTKTHLVTVQNFAFFVDDYTTLGIQMGAFGHWDAHSGTCTLSLGTPVPVHGLLSTVAVTKK